MITLVSLIIALGGAILGVSAVVACRSFHHSLGERVDVVHRRQKDFDYVLMELINGLEEEEVPPPKPVARKTRTKATPKAPSRRSPTKRSA